MIDVHRLNELRNDLNRKITQGTLNNIHSNGDNISSRILSCAKQMIHIADELLTDDYAVSLYNPFMNFVENFITQINLAAQGDMQPIISWYHEKIKGNHETFKDIYSEFNIEYADKIVKKTDQISKEMKDTLAQLREVTREKISDDYIKVYSETANKKNSNSIWWLISAIICFIGLLASLQYFFSIFPKYQQNNAYPGVLTNFLITKVVVISILIFLLSWCLRQYKINKHLYTLNQAKRDSLHSFTAFSATISDPKQKEQITVEIAKLIFGVGTTGYLENKEAEVPTIFNSIGNFKS